MSKWHDITARAHGDSNGFANAVLEAGLKFRSIVAKHGPGGMDIPEVTVANEEDAEAMRLWAEREGREVVVQVTP